MSSDLGDFMSTPDAPRYSLMLKELEHGTGSRLLMVGIEGTETEKLQTASRALAQLLKDSGLYDDVYNGEMSVGDKARDLLFLYRYLLNPHISESSFSIPALTAALRQRLEELSSAFPVTAKQLIRSDPTAAFAGLVQSWAETMPAEVPQHGTWLSRDGKAAFLLVRTKARGTDLDGQEMALATLSATFDEVADQSLRLVVGGPPAIAVATRNAIRADVLRLTIAATTLMVGFLWLVYRQFRTVALVVIPFVSGALAGSALVSWWYGQLHGITIAFGITLLGVAVDYPVHVFSHRQPGETADQCLRRVWATLRLGVLTTVLGYLAMVLTPVAGLAQMGAFTCTGLLTAAAVTRWVLPLLSGTVEAALPGLKLLPAWLLRPAPRRLCWAGVGVGGLALLIVVVTPDRWSENLTDISPLPAEQIRVDELLRSKLGAPDSRYLILVQGDSANQVLLLQERLLPILIQAQRHDEIGTFQMASRYISSLDQQRKRQRLFPDTKTLRQNLAEAAADTPFKPGVFEPFVDQVVTSKTMQPLAWDAFRDIGLDLPLDELLHRTDSGWVGIVQLTAVNHPQNLERRLVEWQGDGVSFVDLKRETGAMVNQFRSETLSKIQWLLGVAVCILALALQSLQRLVRVMTPVLIAATVAASIPLLLGFQLTLFHLVSLLLVAGISLDYGLFFTRPVVDERESIATLHAVIVCAISTSVVFALLMFSAIPVLRAIGMVVTSGVIAALVFGWAFSQRPFGSPRPMNLTAQST